MYGVLRLVRLQAIFSDVWQNKLSESRLAVCHIFLWHDVQDAIVGKPGACLIVIERVAVATLHAAVCCPAKVHDARLVSLYDLNLSHEAGERQSFVALRGCTETATIMVSFVHGFQYIVCGHVNALWFYAYYTHNLMPFFVVYFVAVSVLSLSWVTYRLFHF